MKLKNKQLRKDLKETLNNNVCNVQALDVAVDRLRVLNQIQKMLESKYTIKYEQPRSRKTSTRTKRRSSTGNN